LNHTKKNLSFYLIFNVIFLMTNHGIIEMNSDNSPSTDTPANAACIENADLTPKEQRSLTRQATYYFFFAVLMIGLNLVIQKLHLLYIVPFIST